MADQRIFVGRKAELKRFDEILRDPAGQAILVVGQQGMGKTWLVEEMARRAVELGPALGLTCGTVRYEVTPTDSVDSILELMLDHAYDAAQVVEKSLDGTPRRLEQWRSVLNLLRLGDLVLSLRRDPKRNTRDQFIEKLELISSRMPENGRALFVVDPEKYVQPESDQAWGIVARQLPSRIKLVIAQRSDDAIAQSRDFRALSNVTPIPEKDLDVLDEQAIEDLIDIYASEPGMPGPDELRQAVARYNGHPYAVPAALDLIADGVAIEKLPHDPTKEKVAEAQWERVCEKKKEAIPLFEAYAILEMLVPDDVADAVSGIEPTTRKHVSADPYVKTLLRGEGGNRRLYHSLLADHIQSQIDEKDVGTYHRRAIDEYRRRLKPQLRRDVLAATRLPLHVRLLEGDMAFVSCLVDECADYLLELNLLDTSLDLIGQAAPLVDEKSHYGVALKGVLAHVHRIRGRHEHATQLYAQTLSDALEIGDETLVGAAYGGLGQVSVASGRLEDAEVFIRQSMDLETERGCVLGAAIASSNLGGVLRRMNRTAEARDCHERALRVFEALGFPSGVATQYCSLAHILGDEGRFDEAEVLVRKALGVFVDLGLDGAAASAYCDLGLIQRELGNREGARDSWVESVRLLKPLGRLRMVQKVQDLLDQLPDEGEEESTPSD